MRYIIYGAGAIGGVIGGRLFQSGQDVTLIARGDQYRALKTGGLRLKSSGMDVTLNIPVVNQPTEILFSTDDVVILSTKSHDTESALARLSEVAPPSIRIACAQNGVANEISSLRRFVHTYGMYVFIFATHLVPGVVQYFTEPSAGVLDIGRFPSGTDHVSREISQDLADANFDCIARDHIMRWKYSKLLGNLINAFQAVCDDLDAIYDIYSVARDEAMQCYRAAGIEVVSEEEAGQRRRALLPLKRVDGQPFPGGSSWQSLARDVGHIETDFLNGEIVLLGRLHGVATPVNEAIRHLALRLARGRSEPGSVSAEELRHEMGQLMA